MRFRISRPIQFWSYAVVCVALVACASATDSTKSGDSTDTRTGIAGSFSTPASAQPTLQFSLTLTGSALAGTGTLGTAPITPTSGPSSPAYTGDNFTITSGSFTAPDVSFSASLGSNPDGSGGFYHGTLTFTGTLNGSTISGSTTFTPPRTASQVFSAQTATGVTLTRQK